MATTIYELQTRAKALREKTQEGSITPEEVGGLIADTLALLADVEQTAGSLRVSKVYSSKAEMEADTAPEDAHHQPLKAGQLVAIHAEGDSPDNGTIYVYLAPGWKLIGNLNRVAIGEDMGQAYPGTKGKRLAEDLNNERIERTDNDAALQRAIANETDSRRQALTEQAEVLRRETNKAVADETTARDRELASIRQSIRDMQGNIGSVEGFKHAFLTEEEYNRKRQAGELDPDRCYFIEE